MNLQSSSWIARRDRMAAIPDGSIDDEPSASPLTPESAPDLQPDQFDETQMWRAMAWFVVPQTANAVLQLFSSTVTAIYFGQLLGRWALAVASVFFPIFFL